MPGPGVTIETDEDPATLMLARVLLICEIASQVLASFIVLEMIEHGNLSYQLAWYVKRWRKRYESERHFARDLRYMYWQAHTALEGVDNG